MNRRFAAVLVPLFALSLAACGGSGSEGAPAEVAAPPADPKQALAASTSGIKAGNYSFTSSTPDGTEAKGVVHIPSRSASVDMGIEDEGTKGLIQFRILEPDRYMKMKMDLGQSAKELAEIEEMAGSNPEMKKLADSLTAMTELFSGKHWMKVDMDKLKSADMQIGIENPDLAGVAQLIDGVVTAERTPAGISGTLDATKVTGEGQLFGESGFEGLPAEQGKALPYEATLDAEGRLTKLVLDVPKFAESPAGKWTVDYSGYGAAAKQEAPPAAEVKEMPASAYEMLNSDEK